MSHSNATLTAPPWVEPTSVGQGQILERAVAKIVLMGAQVGVSADQMIQLLQSGLTVGELLDYLAACNREIV